MKTRHDRYKPFIDEIQAASGRYRASDVFVDACHMMALSIWAPLCLGESRRKAEADYRATAEKFDKREFQHIWEAFALLVEALTDKREEFLGHCMNLFEATNKWNGQVLTPISISRLMGGIVAPEPRDEVVKLHDPCCGAGVLMIQGAEALLRKGWKQRNVCVVATDIDYRACDMTYVQLSLLGYAAVVQQVDALTIKPFDVPRYTPGWFLHGFPMRGIKA